MCTEATLSAQSAGVASDSEHLSVRTDIRVAFKEAL